MEKGFLEFERACTNANKYISYEKLVKKAVLDTRPVAYMNISDVWATCKKGCYHRVWFI